MRKKIRPLIPIFIGMAWLLSGPFYGLQASGEPSFDTHETEEEQGGLLSPYWPPVIQRWEALIYKVSYVNGLDPDFVAAVVMAESNGQSDSISYVGAVGLMGVMPAGPGMEWRPTTEALLDPALNLQWGVAILADIIQQSGGDVYAALAAYNGGWQNVHLPVTQEYAAQVLDSYGRAVVIRSGGSAEIASQWTIAIEMEHGHVPLDSLLVLGDEPVSGLHTYGEHILYDYVNEDGQVFYIKAYAVPVALIVPEIETKPPLYKSSDTLESALQRRLGLINPKGHGRNPRIILACLPSLPTLRGRLNTRWFAPSSCPDEHR